MANILLHLLPASFYLGITALCRSNMLQLPSMRVANRGLQAMALLSHAFVLSEAMFGTGGFQFGLFIALSLSLWLAMLIYSLESLITPLNQLLGYATPIAAICAFLPALGGGHPQSIDAENWAFRTHIVVAMLAYSLFTLAVFHAVVLAATERNIHHAATLESEELPPLLSLERILFRIIHAAFVFLTLTVGSGLLFSEQIFGKPFVFSHKAVFGIASWVLFAILILGRFLKGWRGKLAIRWLLAGFACLLLAYAGTRFVLEILLERST
ncbi:inner membrane protein YpjD [Uliginosibacterium sp. TH139]|uniref:cytochrome C assembly family protein n=1 Tax=Uliginosibacterium sp. TH139 TaxID=2067453 RepID=UPI000C7ADC73|nr:cytochrome c biogenesis protein CcsA [Uliginosibacterium sp. TH139]PLK48704.1 cytochrome C biogenesis protein [Uliginosibacterium sp. TH139]